VSKTKSFTRATSRARTLAVRDKARCEEGVGSAARVRVCRELERAGLLPRDGESAMSGEGHAAARARSPSSRETTGA